MSNSIIESIANRYDVDTNTAERIINDYHWEVKQHIKKNPAVRVPTLGVFTQEKFHLSAGSVWEYPSVGRNKKRKLKEPITISVTKFS